jgi:hypothetical protein
VHGDRAAVLAPELERVLGIRVAAAIVNGSRAEAETAMREFVRAASAAFLRPAARPARTG